MGLIDTNPHTRSNQKVAFGVAVNIEWIAPDDLQLFFFNQPIHDFLYLFIFEIASIQFNGMDAPLNLLNLHNGLPPCPLAVGAVVTVDLVIFSQGLQYLTYHTGIAGCNIGHFFQTAV